MLTIAQVERETGLSKDVLRVWERRYGFPVPARDEAGDRLYDAQQVERLRTIKRLMDQGFRPGKLLSMAPEEFEGLARAQPAGESVALQQAHHQAVIEHVLSDDSLGLRLSLTQLLAKQGLQRFVQDTVPALNEEIGNGWARGRLAVHQEHLYSEEMSRLLRSAIGSLPSGSQPPRILLTTLPGEEHGLGLLMVEGMLAPEGVQCISLGLQTPIDDIKRAANAYGIDVLVLSFSIAYSSKQGLAALQSLRASLPEHIEIWAGGGMTRSLKKHKLPGIHWTPELGDCLARLSDWRIRHAAMV
jgi:DNA-binding transcriptional MerR regulator/methylmalonyl-CoA mutase cobalamin-binding subunit